MKSIFKLGMKIRYFSIFAKVELSFICLKSRKNYSNLSFYLKWTSLCITSTSRLPLGYTKLWSSLLLFCGCEYISGIGVWWCDGCRQEDRTPIPKGLETEEHVSSFFLPWSCFLCPSWITMFLIVWFKLVLWSWISVPFTLSCQILIKRAIFFGKRAQV